MSIDEIRVVIADDHPIFRRGLCQILASDPAIKIVGEASDGETALQFIRDSSPQVAVLDIDMPVLDGFGVLRAVREQRLEIAVIFLTMHKEESLLNDALDLGAAGYVLKDGAIAELIGAVRAAAYGQTFISPVLSGYLLGRRTRADALAAEKPGLGALTAAELRVLRLVADNKTSREIAEALFISVRTVEHHRAHICEKLNLHGSNALIKFAVAHKSELS
jgi:DNA-binding NarL/FixJ family response regulator